MVEIKAGFNQIPTDKTPDYPDKITVEASSMEEYEKEIMDNIYDCIWGVAQIRYEIHLIEDYGKEGDINELNKQIKDLERKADEWKLKLGMLDTSFKIAMRRKPGLTQN